jgi:hypothetical protein
MDTSKELKKRLRDIHEYHIEEYAERLEEIGGPGVGGTEPRYNPHLITEAETSNELKMMALQDSIFRLWNEATWCYVYGHFRACIALMAILLEATLKLEFENRDIEYEEERATLGTCIRIGEARGILPREITEVAYRINDRRNDVMHANIERQKPESILNHTGSEHEVRPIKDISRNIKDGWITGNGETIEWSRGKGWRRINLYKRAAKETIEDTEKILKFLYPK